MKCLQTPIQVLDYLSYGSIGQSENSEKYFSDRIYVCPMDPSEPLESRFIHRSQIASTGHICKNHVFQNAKFFFLYNEIRCSFRQSIYSLEVILAPSESLNDPTSSIPTLAGQNITPPPPCCHLIR